MSQGGETRITRPSGPNYVNPGIMVGKPTITVTGTTVERVPRGPAAGLAPTGLLYDYAEPEKDHIKAALLCGSEPV